MASLAEHIAIALTNSYVINRDLSGSALFSSKHTLLYCMNRKYNNVVVVRTIGDVSQFAPALFDSR